MQAIVTGASRGLGLALTRALVEPRMASRRRRQGRQGALERAVGELDGVVLVPGDVADAEHRRRLVAAAGATHRPARQQREHCSGPAPLPLLAEYPLEELRRVYEANVVAPLALVQLALPAPRRRRRGSST